MCKPFLLLIAAAMLASFAKAQNISALLEEGYSIAELEEIWSNVDYNNHNKWLKKKGYTYKGDKSGYFYYDKNSTVSLALFYSGKQITEIVFHSSPQKYYGGLETITDDKSYRKIAETMGNNGGGAYMEKAKWVKNGFVFYANSENNNIGIYKDVNNESSKPTVPDKPKVRDLSKTEIADIEKRVNQEYEKKGSASKAPAKEELIAYLNAKAEDVITYKQYPKGFFWYEGAWLGEQNGKLKYYIHDNDRGTKPDLQYQEFIFDPADLQYVFTKSDESATIVKFITLECKATCIQYNHTRPDAFTGTNKQTWKKFDFRYNSNIANGDTIVHAFILLKRMAQGL